MNAADLRQRATQPGAPCPFCDGTGHPTSALSALADQLDALKAPIREAPTTSTVIATAKHNARDIRLVYEGRDDVFTIERKWEDALGVEQWEVVESGSDEDLAYTDKLFYKLAFSKAAP